MYMICHVLIDIVAALLLACSVLHRHTRYILHIKKEELGSNDLAELFIFLIFEIKNAQSINPR